jgi:NADH:ubiquinone oxidoreductase subunit C
MSDDTARENPHEAEPETGAPAAPADEVAAALLERFAGSVFNDSHGQPVVYVDRAVWHDVARFLRDEQEFTMCLDITAVDHLLDGVRYRPEAVVAERFEIVSNFLSHTRNRRIRVICEVPGADPSIASIVDVYPGMAFGEREVFDMFGITFEGHADLARILMPDDWEGHPLRKDYPTARVPVTFKGDPSPR